MLYPHREITITSKVQECCGREFAAKLGEFDYSIVFYHSVSAFDRRRGEMIKEETDLSVTSVLSNLSPIIAHPLAAFINAYEQFMKSIFMCRGIFIYSYIFFFFFFFLYICISGNNDRIGGKGHGNHVSGLIIKDNFVYTSGIDDTIKAIGESYLIFVI